MPAADVAASQAGVALLLGEDQRLQVAVQGVGIGYAKTADRRAERVDDVFAWIGPQFHVGSRISLLSWRRPRTLASRGDPGHCVLAGE